MSIPNKLFRIINGGVMSLNLFRVANSVTLYNQEPKKDYELPLVSEWQSPRGEILFFVKPSDYLIVEVTTDKEIYSPGEIVEYEV